jgi:hypothetical protein
MFTSSFIIKTFVMKKIPHYLFCIILLFICGPGNAQLVSNNKISKAAAEMTRANNSVTTATSTVNTTLQSIDLVKKSFGAVLGGNKTKLPGLIYIQVPGIEYDDPNLAQLRTGIAQLKNDKNVSMEYKSGTAVIIVKHKGNCSEIWDKISAAIKMPFKLLEAGEGIIMLEYKLGSKTNPPSSVPDPGYAKADLIQHSVSKSTNEIDFIEFKIDGQHIRIDKNDPLWQSIYVQKDDQATNPKIFRALGMKMGFTGGGTFNLVLMDIKSTLKSQTSYTVQAGEPIQPLILDFSYTTSDQIKYATSIKESDPHFRTDGNLIFTRFENVEGGVAEGSFSFSNIVFKDSRGNVLSENHTLSEGKFKLTVHQLMPNN